jgi:pimeloyl-ACP methyl ester carboxylesterase
VVDIGPKYYPPHHQEIIDSLLSVDFSSVTSRKDVEKQLELKIENIGIRLFLMKNLTRVTEGGYRWKMNLQAIVKNIENVGEALAEDLQYDGSTLFVRGSNSDYILDGDFETVVEQFPLAKLVTVPDAGHWVHAEQPKLLFEEVIKFGNE